MNRQKKIRRRIHRYFGGILAGIILCLLCGMPVMVHAEEADNLAEGAGSLAQMSEPLVDETEEPPVGRAAEPYALAEEYSTTEAFLLVEERVKEAILNGEKDAQISDLKLNKDKYHLVELEYYSPYFGNGIRLSLFYGMYSKNYTRVSISNPMSAAETQNYFAAIDNEIAQITGQVTGNMPEEQKALLVHDYFVCNYEYDYARAANGTMPEESYRSGGLFYDKIGVCQAYAYGYQYIMNRLGMECYVTTSDEMVHAWNILNVDGAYYHVDCTWDDPVPDRFGGAYHGYFLVSDQAIQSVRNIGTSSHFGWNRTDIVCSSGKYDSAYWMQADSPVLFSGDYAYFIKGRSIVRHHLSKQTTENLKDLERWSVWGNSSQYYAGVYSGLVLYKNELIFNTPVDIKKISLDGKSESVIYQPDISGGYIYGCRKSGDRLQYILKQNPENKPDCYEIALGSGQPVQNPVADGWQYRAGKWYYYENGKTATGWKQVGDLWYYMNADGSMASDTWIEGCYVDGSGAWIPGYQTGTWMLDSVGWWYQNQDGSYPVSMWKEISGKWYFFNESGYCVYGWIYWGNTWYYMDASGAMATGWALVNGTWYYMNPSGAMATGWVLVNGTWYYMNPSGAMATGWIYDGTAWYYMESDGSMAVNRWIGNDYVGWDGKWS